MNRPRVRCFSCGRWQSRADEYCTRCGRPFRAICDCGAAYDLHADSCAACGHEYEPRRLSWRRHPFAVWSRRLLAAGLVGGVAYLALAPRPPQAWELKKQANESFARRDFDAAAAGFRRVTELMPGDATSWHMLALSYRRMDLGPELVAPVLRRALALRPDLVEGLRLMAQLEQERGRIDAALALARRAVRIGGEKASDLEYFARLELQAARPDLARVARTLQAAGAAEDAGVDVPVLLAEVLLLRHGDAVTASVVPEVAHALWEADQAMSSEAATTLPPVARLQLRARVRLALGREEEALRDVDEALRSVDPGDGKRLIASLRLVRGRALHLLGHREHAYAELRTALELAPTAGTAFAVARHLEAASDAAAAETLLAAATDRDGAGSGVHAALAAVRLSRGDADGALEAVRTARGAHPDDPDVALLEGDVQRARGDPEGARRAYHDAIRAAPDRIEGHVLTALLALDAHQEPADRRAAVLEAAATLRALTFGHAEEPFLWRALGALEADVGEAVAAVASLERCTRLDPLDVDGWVRLARARAATGTAGAFAAAARAYAAARRLRPDDAGIVLEEVAARLATWDAAAAVAACSGFLERHPAHVPVRELRVRAHLQLSEWELAARDLRQLIEQDAPGRPRLLLVDTLFNAGRRQLAREESAALRAELEASEDPSREGTLAALDVLDAVHAGDAATAARRLAEREASRIQVRLLLALGDLERAVVAARRLLTTAAGDDDVKQLLVFALLDRPEAGPEAIAEAREVWRTMTPTAAGAAGALAQGRILLAEHRFDEAREPLKEAVAARPGDARAQLLLGDALFLSGEREESLARYERVVALPSARPRFRTHVALRLLQASDEVDDAARADELVVAAHRLDPQGPGPAERMALLLERRGDLQRMTVTLERALASGRAEGDLVDRLRLLAGLAGWRSRDLAATERHLAALRPAGTRLPLARALGALVALELGRPDEAERTLEDLAGSRGPVAPLVFVGRVECALRRDDAEAAAALCAAWRTAPAEALPFYLAALELLASRGHLQRALEEVQRLRIALPSSFEALRLEVRLLERLGRRREALETCERHVAAFDDDLDGRLLLAWAHVHLGGDGVAALEIAREVLLHPEGSGASELLSRVVAAEALLLLGRSGDAAQLARLLAARWPTGSRSVAAEARVEARVRFVLGSALAETGAFGAAADELSRSVELDPARHAAANNLAWVLSRRRVTALRGLRVAQQLTEGWPQYASYWDTRASCAVAASDSTDAEESWARAQRLFAADAAADPEARGRSALRHAAFLRGEGREKDALRVAREVLDYAADKAVGARARDFLDAE